MRVVTSVSPTTTYGLHLCQPDFAHRTMSTMPARGNEWCVQYTLGAEQGERGRVLPKISDKSVLPRVLNPDPMQGQDRQKLILYLRPKSVKGKTKSKNLKEAHKSSLHRIPYTQR